MSSDGGDDRDREEDQEPDLSNVSTKTWVLGAVAMVDVVTSLIHTHGGVRINILFCQVVV